uniref:Metalloendopeptidase n=1 Tax=Romanomermis culicivorax TaxID=13658 RepID=A0A915J9A5_ROMCU
MISFFYFCSLFAVSIYAHEKFKSTVSINFDLDDKVPKNANIDAYCAKNYASDRNLCLQNLKIYCFGLSLSKKSPESTLCSAVDQSGLQPPKSSATPKVAPSPVATKKVRKASKVMLDHLNEKINHEHTKKASSDVMSYNDRTINNRLFFKQSDAIKNFRFKKNELDVNRVENYFHGDVDLTEKQVKIIEENVNKNRKKTNGDDDKRRKKKNLRRARRKVGKEPAFHLWTKFPIPYDFVDAVPMKMRIIIEEAIQVWQNNTCVRWQKNGVGVDRIEFVDGDGCSSFIGKVDGTQEISLHYPGCELVGIAAHEIGFFHEQSRPDQKENVVINYDNIVKSRYNNFSPMDWKDVNAYQLPYDFGSVMHYDGFTRGFTVDPEKYSIVTLDPSYQNTIGQRVGPSFIDFKQINAAYCANTCPKKIGCQNNGYENPNDCNRCKCPPGFGGLLCETVESSNSPDCGGRLKLTAADHVKSPKYLTSPKYPDKYSTNLKCNWLIEGPTDDSKISLEFVDGDPFDLPCNVPCADSYLEIKGTIEDTTTFRNLLEKSVTNKNPVVY